MKLKRKLKWHLTSVFTVPPRPASGASNSTPSARKYYISTTRRGALKSFSRSSAQAFLGSSWKCFWHSLKTIFQFFTKKIVEWSFPSLIERQQFQQWKEFFSSPYTQAKRAAAGKKLWWKMAKICAVGIVTFILRRNVFQMIVNILRLAHTTMAAVSLESMENGEKIHQHHRRTTLFCVPCRGGKKTFKCTFDRKSFLCVARKVFVVCSPKKKKS